MVMITADHGCDPAYTATTDHTREYIPILVAGKKIKPTAPGDPGGLLRHRRYRGRGSGRDAGYPGQELFEGNAVKSNRKGVGAAFF